MNLSRWFRPRWRRLADEADAHLADGTRCSANGLHIRAAAHMHLAGSDYVRAAACAPDTQLAYELRMTAAECFYKAAAANDTCGHQVYPRWPPRERGEHELS